MAIRAVTLDFHNTIARCERWFALEVRELVPEILRVLTERGELPPDPALPDRARAAYRALREEIVATGDERDAQVCAVTTLAAVGIVLPEATVARAIDGLMREAVAEATPMPGVIAAVNTLRARGLRLGVVSSAVHHPFLDWALANFGIAGAFTTVITSASCGYYKSRPEIYHEALRGLGTAAGETIHVGDSYRFDVLGAQRAGMRAIWYASTEQALAQPENVAIATIADLATLPTVLTTIAEEDGPAKRRWWQR